MSLGLSDVDERLYDPYIPHGGFEDEQTAYALRLEKYCKNPPMTNVPGLAYQIARELGKSLQSKWSPITAEQVVESYHGALKKRYQDALDSLYLVWISRRDATLKSFVKRDKVSPTAFNVKAPRMINPRDPRYGVLLARFIKPFEKALFSKRRHKLPLFAKGLNARDRYKVIREIFDSIPGCYVSTIDCKAFDAHVTVDQLRLEHMVYTTGCNDDLLAQLLGWQLKNKLAGSFGLSQVVNGVRMSGDMNTACGNCVIIYIIMESFIRHHNLRKHLRYFDDGDDCLLFTDRVGKRFLPALPKWFEQFGHQLVVETNSYDFEDIVFCQARPFNTSRIMIRDWRKVISHSFVSNKHYHTPAIGVKVMKSVAVAELSLNPMVPIMSIWFDAWNRKLEGIEVLGDEFLDESLKRRVSDGWRSGRYVAPDSQARFEFWMLYGIDPTEQQLIEQKLINYVDEYPLQDYMALKVMGEAETRLRDIF
jgi:hypothetical protein